MRKNFLSPILFHYTDAETARTIIRTQEFRLSPKEKLNDNHQISAYLERAHRIAIELLGEKKVGGDFLEHMKKWVPEKYFIGCFTESPNNQWMWSNYAKNGGVCMSFYDEGFRAHHKNLDLTIHKMNYPTIEEWDAETAKYFEDISPLLGLNERFKEFREGLASVLIQCIANKNELYNFYLHFLEI